MEIHEQERSANKKIADASYSVSRLLEDYYDLAESKDLSQDDKKQIKDLAAELKTHTVVLQNMMGSETAKESDQKKAKDENSDHEKKTSDEKDEFLAGLEED